MSRLGAGACILAAMGLVTRWEASWWIRWWFIAARLVSRLVQKPGFAKWYVLPVRAKQAMRKNKVRKPVRTERQFLGEPVSRIGFHGNTDFQECTKQCSKRKKRHFNSDRFKAYKWP